MTAPDEVAPRLDGQPNRRKADRSRTAEIAVEFEDGRIKGWAFGVTEVYREALDIRLGEFVDKEATTELRSLKGNRDANKKLRFVKRREFRIGTPPARSFGVGDVFYCPANVRDMVWADAVKTLTHALQIIDAQPDRLDDGLGGWVEFIVLTFSGGEVTARSRQKSSQAEFERTLKFGVQAKSATE